jgi:hypothetical protein
VLVLGRPAIEQRRFGNDGSFIRFGRVDGQRCKRHGQRRDRRIHVVRQRIDHGRDRKRHGRRGVLERCSGRKRLFERCICG